MANAIQGPKAGAIPTFTAIERAYRDELVMVRMFGMRSLMLRAHDCLITPEDIVEVEI